MFYLEEELEAQNQYVGKASEESANMIINFPYEIFLAIMKPLKNKDLKAMSCVCNSFYNAVATGHFRSLYATSSRFIILQRTQLTILQGTLKKYEKSLKVSVLTPTRVRGLSMLRYLPIPISMGLALLLLYRYGYKRQEFSALIAALLLTCLLTTYLFNNIESNDLLNRTLDTQALDDLQKIVDAIKPIIPTENRLVALLASHRVGPKTFNESLRALKNEISAFEDFIEQFETFCLSTRLKNVRTIPISDFSPDARSYLKASVNFWNNQKSTDTLALQDDAKLTIEPD